MCNRTAGCGASHKNMADSNAREFNGRTSTKFPNFFVKIVENLGKRPNLVGLLVK